MAVTIGGNDVAAYIIDSTSKKTKLTFLPEWINDATPEIDTDIWDKKVDVYIYIMRVSHQIKWSLDQILRAHNTVLLVDDYRGLNYYVWIRRVEAEWEGDINWSRPWAYTIEVIIV